MFVLRIAGSTTAAALVVQLSRPCFIATSNDVAAGEEQSAALGS
jgi:hypothetical protein